jgi:uncharacterized membrane protein YeaQ/YmgE (transglycosylase-associated protein family)
MIIDLIGFLVFGLLVGGVARLLKPGKDALSLPMTLGLGVVGSLVGGFVANLLGTGGVFELNTLGAIVAVVAAIGLLVFAERRVGGQKSIDR